MKKQKYNIALLPITINKQVIELAQKFSSLPHEYLLNNKNSFPHVTLYQFWTHQEKISEIWQQTSELIQHSVDLTFNEFSFTTSDNITYWIALLPEPTDVLFQMHETVANILGLKSKLTFDPHMTLLNTTKSDCQNIIEDIANSYVPFTDTFKLAIGKCDEIGQFTKIISTTYYPD